MEGRVQVISRETILPSSKTPNHNKTIQFSYIDQVLGEIYGPFIFFYQSDDSTGLTASNHPQISLHLKHSLSHCLPSFYPLAGRVNDNRSVICNDAGVEFIEARAHARLADALYPYVMEDLKQYLPLDPTNTFGHDMTTPLLLVQLTLFDCGGFALGVCVSHKVADLNSAMEFVKAWSARCRDVYVDAEPQASVIKFKFGTSSYFPPNFVLARFRLSDYLAIPETLEFRRFVFDKEKLALLKKAATISSPSRIGSVVSDPSRVELVSAFIWKQYIEAAKSRGRRGEYFAFHAVNLRRRMSHLENVFGNCAIFATASARSDGYGGFPGLIGELRTAIRKVRGDRMVKPFRRSSALMDIFKVAFMAFAGRADRCMFTSWRGFDAYGIDYGWGKPVWFTSVGLRGNNGVILMDSRSGDGVEAIVKADKDVLARIEKHMPFSDERGCQ